MERFETAELRIDSSGIALLRSRYAYRRFAFPEIDEILIKKGNVVKNPVILFLTGILLISISVIIFTIVNPINFPNIQLGVRGGKALGYFFFMVGGLLCFGGILIFQSLKKDFVICITAPAFKASYPLTELRRNNGLDNLILYLKENVGKKLKINTSEFVRI